MTPITALAKALLVDEGQGLAERAMQRLTAAGYSIIHDSENHGPTVERAAEIAEKEAEPYAHSIFVPHVCNCVAASIRSMTTGGRDAALPDEVRE